MLEDYLLQVRKPARYIGKEYNAAKKDFAKSEVKFALCFPDLYEVGMSNLGLRILYGLLNDIPDVSCERFFSPALDMEEILRQNKIEIYSLESSRRLKDFDIVGFSLGYELGYTNVLNILDLGLIPLRAIERDARFPLVIAGGPCVFNPEPMHEFFDFFVIGEAEETILEIIGLYRKLKEKFKSKRLSKEELLILFSGIEGVYAPSLYELNYSGNGKISEFKPKFKNVPPRIKKRFVKDLNKAYFPTDWIVPYIEIVHDRISLEIMRGCPNQCRFCQARQIYSPLRIRSQENALGLAARAYQKTGYEEISLAGLSVSDYPFIEGLLNNLFSSFKEKTVSISLPSIKPNVYLGNLACLIATVKKTGLTFAPEAATEKLRQIINKDFDTDSFFGALEQAYLKGYQRVKLYFMAGLPSEKEEDLDGILDFAISVSQARRKLNKPAAFINISINIMIPKPHTPFQWLGMEDIEKMQAKGGYLRKKLKDRRVKLNFHNTYMSFLEGVLSRGDRRLSSVIELAFKKGARFDAWDEFFVFEKWLDAFNQGGVKPAVYLAEKSIDELLPWDFIDTGTSKEILLAEYKKAIEIK